MVDGDTLWMYSQQRFRVKHYKALYKCCILLLLCVKSFCYLGDTLDGVDITATDRIRNGWMKCRDIFPFLTSRAPPMEIKCRVYASCVRRSMTYRSETMPLLADVGLKFERADDKMEVWCFHERGKDK